MQDKLLSDLDRQMEANRSQGLIVISGGISRFDPERDNSFHTVFERADEKMYQRKRILKGTG